VGRGREMAHKRESLRNGRQQFDNELNDGTVKMQVGGYPNFVAMDRHRVPRQLLGAWSYRRETSANHLPQLHHHPQEPRFRKQDRRTRGMDGVSSRRTCMGKHRSIQPRDLPTGSFVNYQQSTSTTSNELTRSAGQDGG
jgi:hypothetical protein